jgi:DNA polymerase-3 subunit alpha
MSSVAITDHGVLHGVIPFYKSCRAIGIKPVIGLEGYITRDLSDKTAGKQDYNHLTILAATNEGYQNLIKIASIAQLEGFYYKPRIDLSLLSLYKEGLFVSAGCLAGMIPQAVLASLKGEVTTDVPERILDSFLSIFGEHFYIEVMDNLVEEQYRYNEFIIPLARKKGVRICLTADAHYLQKEDHPIHDILMAIGTKSKVDDKDRQLKYGPEFYIKSPAEMNISARKLSCLEAVGNTLEIAKQCNVEITFGKFRQPVFIY